MFPFYALLSHFFPIFISFASEGRNFQVFLEMQIFRTLANFNVSSVWFGKAMLFFASILSIAKKNWNGVFYLSAEILTFISVSYIRWWQLDGSKMGHLIWEPSDLSHFLNKISIVVAIHQIILTQNCNLIC